jgi:hypothetical protein
MATQIYQKSRSARVVLLLWGSVLKEWLIVKDGLAKNSSEQYENKYVENILIHNFPFIIFCRLKLLKIKPMS